MNLVTSRVSIHDWLDKNQLTVNFRAVEVEIHGATLMTRILTSDKNLDRIEIVTANAVRS